MSQLFSWICLDYFWPFAFPYKYYNQCVNFFSGIKITYAAKESACNAGDLGLIPGLGRSPGEGNSYPLQYSGLENSVDCIVHGLTKSQTWLSDFHFTSLHFIGILITIPFSLQTSLGKINTFTVLSHIIHKHGISFYFLNLFLNFLNIF